MGSTGNERLSEDCVVGFNYMRDRRISLAFFEKSLVVNRDENTLRLEL